MDTSYLDLAPGSQLGNAVYVGNLVDGSDDWHTQRSKVIGGSEVAPILGVPGAFDSVYMLWLKKAGLYTPPEPDPELARLFRIGHLTEPVTAQLVEDELPHLMAVPTGSWVSKDNAFHGANPDRLLVERETGQVKAILELKYSSSGYGWENGYAPEKYIVQLRWYMAAFGITLGYLACLDGGKLHLFEVQSNPALPVVDALTGESFHCPYEIDNYALNQVADFVDSLPTETSPGTPPPPVLDNATKEYLAQKHPDIKDESVEVSEALATRLWYARTSYDAAETELRGVKGELMFLMGDMKSAIYDGKTLAQRRAKGGGKPYLQVIGKPVETATLQEVEAAPRPPKTPESV